MLMSSSLGLTSLKHFDPDRVQLTNVVLALLNGKRNCSEQTLITQPVQSLGDAHHMHWVVCNGGTYLNIAHADGRSWVFGENRLAEMVGALDAAELLLSEIEVRTGIALDPIESVESIPDNSLIFEIITADQQYVVYLALLTDFTARPTLNRLFDALEIDWSQVPVAFEVAIAGPALSIESAAEINSGDMILIGGATTLARIAWPVGEAVLSSGRANMAAGRFDIFSGVFIVNGVGDAMTVGDASGANGFSVPITIRLPNRMTSAAELSAMRPGTTINIGAITQGLAVSILIADKEIARGELVQVGDQFAVLIEQKIVQAERQTQTAQATGDVE
jgi:predicted RecA/RadA family phage recombinase